MIKSFRHKGIKALYLSGSAKGVRADHVARLRRILASLDVAKAPDDMDEPGMRLHPLKGELVGFWSVSVSGNWRVIFRFIETDVELVDYLDYH
ncbi:type II toxin-antitoxin system RelE/ParE family toxin [Pseudomonas sp. Marseille-Q5115]|uniref:type II toxin-antitoxin system RelE/ParE family toxin n=1 Tax=Pseudomonas sp. Marseille-Q5115 TaxID=2866593 RepID=UPI001CE3EA25|nr:type II toxin-antitoxin system RelE/ParE family toxin [Pseudomonas sp. Marseille-Q5115]